MGNLSTPKTVQKLRKALHAKAKAEAGYRFYALCDKISRDDILAYAFAQCRSNKGAPGVDGQDFADIETYGVEFADEKIELCNLFKASDLSLLEEMLMEALDSAARFARIQSFLLRNLHTRQPDPVVCRAAQSLRRNPALRVRRLAAQLDVCERHLSRSFRAMFGASPEQFARVARIEKILAMRRRIGLGGYRLRLRLCRPSTYDQRFRRHRRRAAATALPHDCRRHR